MKFINFGITLKLVNLWQVIQENAGSIYHKDFPKKDPKKGYQLQLCQETGCFLQNFTIFGLFHISYKMKSDSSKNILLHLQPKTFTFLVISTTSS